MKNDWKSLINKINRLLVHYSNKVITFLHILSVQKLYANFIVEL